MLSPSVLPVLNRFLVSTVSVVAIMAKERIVKKIFSCKLGESMLWIFKQYFHAKFQKLQFEWTDFSGEVL